MFLENRSIVIHQEWPLPDITRTIAHCFWDSMLFIIGYWLAKFLMKNNPCCSEFDWRELTIMVLWGSIQEFVVELSSNGVMWEYIEQPWNPVWLTINGQGYTLLPQLVWLVAPVFFYLGVLKINSKYLDPNP